jgi:hypothetical protein
VADEPDRRVHALEAGVGESEIDGVGDLVAVDVEGKGDTDERAQLARQRGEDPVAQKRGCLVVVVRQVDAAQLLDQKPAGASVLVGRLELTRGSCDPRAAGYWRAVGSRSACP